MDEPHAELAEHVAVQLRALAAEMVETDELDARPFREELADERAAHESAGPGQDDSQAEGKGFLRPGCPPGTRGWKTSRDPDRQRECAPRPISAPARMSLDTIRVFVVSKLGWIRQQQRKLREQERETPREYLDRDSHHVWGRRHLLKVIETAEPPSGALSHGRMALRVRPGTDPAKRQALLEGWYREQVRQAVPPLIAKWEPRLGVKAQRLFVRRMKTKWGSCNQRAQTVRLNTDLAKKPRECLEHLVVHELVHLLKPTHNARFIALMEQLLSKWRSHRQILSRLPVRHDDWSY